MNRSRSRPEGDAGGFGGQSPRLKNARNGPGVGLSSDRGAPSTRQAADASRPRRGPRPRGRLPPPRSPRPRCSRSSSPSPRAPASRPSSRPSSSEPGPSTRRGRSASPGSKTEADLLALQDELRRKALDVIGGPARREDAPQPPRHGHDPDGRLPDREGRLREPARHPRHRPRLRARRPAGTEARRARGLRPLAARQGLPGLPGDRRAPRAARLRRPLLGSRGPGRAQPVLGQGPRPQPLQPRLRRARRARQLRDDRRHEPRALHGLGRHARASTTS